MNQQRMAEELPALIYRHRDAVDIPCLAPGVLWRDLMNSPRGSEIVETVTSPFALQRAGLFDTQLLSFLRAFWIHLPRKSRLLQQIDPLMGFVIRQQIHHELTVARPVDPQNPLIPAVPGKVELSDWDLFVLRHTKSSNHFIHLMSLLMFYVSPILALYYWNPYWMILFFTSGFMGTFGHFITQDGGVSLREATTQQKVPLYVIKMFYLIVTGRYPSEIAAAKAKL